VAYRRNVNHSTIAGVVAQKEIINSLRLLKVKDDIKQISKNAENECNYKVND